jgi:type I restriction enzyme, S subunit
MSQAALSDYPGNNGLPRGWTWAKLGTLGNWSGGGTPSKQVAAFWTGGEIPWVSPKDMKSDVVGDAEDRITAAALEGSATKLVPAGSVLMVVRSGILRHTFPVAVSDRAVTLNQDMKALTPRRSVDARYVYHFLRFANAKIIADCSKDGTTVQSVDFDRLKALDVPLAPEGEQPRIAARIDALFAQVNEGETELREARKLLDVYRQSVLKAAVTGELTADWRRANRTIETGADLLARTLAGRREAWITSGKSVAKFPLGSKLDVGQLPPLPKTWTWCRVDQAGDVLLGRQRAPQHHEGDHMRPYLRVANVLEDRLDLSDVKRMNFTPAEFEKYRLQFGDVLLNEGQAPDLIGRPAVFRDEIAGCCFQKTLLRFRADVGVDFRYALIVFRHYMRSGRFKKASRITTNIGHLTLERLVEMEFPLPPSDEQREIAERVAAQEVALDHVTLAGAERLAAALKQTVLAEAFAGRLHDREPTHA